MSVKRTQYLIIGGGPVGIQTCRMLKAKKPEANVVVLRPEPYSVIYCAIPYLIEGLLEPSQLAKKDELITGTGAELIKTAAVKVDFQEHLVTLKDQTQIQYENLIIATGALPFIPPVPGKELNNIFTVKTAEDAARIKAVAEKAEKVVVIGAGAIGIEQAQAMKALGKEVHLVDMAPHPLSNMVDAEFGDIILKQVLAADIFWHGACMLEKFEGQGAVEKVHLSDKSSIALQPGIDFVIVSAGVKAEVSLFENSGLEILKDGIKVNENMETSIKNVYAAGDCVQYVSGIDQKPLGGKLATNAVPMAKVLAKNLLGVKASYRGFYNGAATCVGDLRIGGTGFTEKFAESRGFKAVCGFGETTSRFPIMPGARPVKVKLVADAETGKLIGGQVIGPDAVAERIDVLSLALQSHLTIADLADLSYSAQPWQTFYPAANAIVMAAEDLLNKLKKS